MQPEGRLSRVSFVDLASGRMDRLAQYPGGAVCSVDLDGVWPEEMVSVLGL